MSLIGRWFERLYPKHSAAPLSTPDTQAEAQRAIGRATRDLDIVTQREPVVRAVVKDSRDHFDKNHFAELAMGMMRGVG